MIERAGLVVDTIELVPDLPGLRLANVHPGARSPAIGPTKLTVAKPPVEMRLQASDPTAYREDLTRIRAASDQGDHTLAVVLARDLDGRLAASLGVDHPDVWAAREVHAWESVMAGRYLQGCELYRDVARRRIRALPNDPTTVVGPTNCAHAAWLRIASGDDARRVGPSIVALRELVPGRSGRALSAARHHLVQLQEDDPEVQIRRSPEAWSAYLGRQTRQSATYAGTSRSGPSNSAAWPTSRPTWAPYGRRPTAPGPGVPGPGVAYRGFGARVTQPEHQMGSYEAAVPKPSRGQLESYATSAPPAWPKATGRPPGDSQRSCEPVLRKSASPPGRAPGPHRGFAVLGRRRGSRWAEGGGGGHAGGLVPRGPACGAAWNT